MTKGKSGGVSKGSRGAWSTIDSFPWPAEDREASALQAAKQLLAILTDDKTPKDSPLYSRALAAAEEAARTLWSDTWENRCEDARLALDLALASKREAVSQRRRVDDALQEDLRVAIKIHGMPESLTLNTWKQAVQIWAEAKAGKTSGGVGEWKALGLIFGKTARALKEAAAKPAKTRGRS